eukprot:CAMPEP_0185735248 /NCGR_PEP_ID=MMETSP1171-20130828/24696_1 /TAXON_ID=374046 /ORGANISM="Helicotheca tamensis, Strain CCMP826" /LENGTH=190 /DNA_ID=CAMNT_0028405471 /DNA_START=21 /DNA_END=593 /DNA_ORIENTATION=+
MTAQKRVRFANQPGIEIIPSRCDFSIEERNDLWWKREDYFIFSQSVDSICREVRRLDYASCLVNALDSVTEKTEDPSQLKALIGLVQWCTHGHCRRGLEMYSNLAYFAAREQTKELARRSVVDEQNRQRELFGETDAAMIRRLSEEATRSSRRFASMMGTADAAAAHESKTDTVSSFNVLCHAYLRAQSI